MCFRQDRADLTAQQLHSINVASCKSGVLLRTLIRFSFLFPYISANTSRKQPLPLGVNFSFCLASLLCPPSTPLCLADGKSMTHFSLNSLHLVLYYRPQGPPPFNYSC